MAELTWRENSSPEDDFDGARSFMEVPPTAEEIQDALRVAELDLRDAFRHSRRDGYVAGSISALKWLLGEGPSPISGVSSPPTALRHVKDEADAALKEIDLRSDEDREWAIGSENVLCWGYVGGDTGTPYSMMEVADIPPQIPPSQERPGSTMFEAALNGSGPLDALMTMSILSSDDDVSLYAHALIARDWPNASVSDHSDPLAIAHISSALAIDKGVANRDIADPRTLTSRTMAIHRSMLSSPEYLAAATELRVLKELVTPFFQEEVSWCTKIADALWGNNVAAALSQCDIDIDLPDWPTHLTDMASDSVIVGLANACALSAESLAAKAQITSDAVLEVVALVGTRCGEISRADPIRLVNQIRRRPLLVTADGMLLCPDWQLLVRAFRIALEEKLKGTKNWHPYDKARKDYLEALALRIVADSLPECWSFRDVRYEWQGRECEADGLVVIGNVAIPIECKAGGLSPAALDGTEEAFEEGLRDRVVEGIKQAERTADAIHAGKSLTGINPEGRRKNIDIGSVTRMIPLVVTLDDYSAVTGWRNLLRDSKYYDALRLPVLVLSAHELSSITSEIAMPEELLHFAVWRQRVSVDGQIAQKGELNHFASYRQTDPAVTFDLERFVASIRASGDEPYRSPLFPWVEKLSLMWPDGIEAALALLDVPFEQANEMRHRMDIAAAQVQAGEPGSYWASRSSGHFLLVNCQEPAASEERIGDLLDELLDADDVEAKYLVGLSFDGGGELNGTYCWLNAD